TLRQPGHQGHVGHRVVDVVHDPGLVELAHDVHEHRLPLPAPALPGLRVPRVDADVVLVLEVHVSTIPASSGVLSPLRELQVTQQTTRFSGLSPPPRERGITWSKVISSPESSCLQYRQRWPSRASTLCASDLSQDSPSLPNGISFGLIKY